MKKSAIKRVETTVTLTEQEQKFWWYLSKRTKLTPDELMGSVLRRHVKSRYQIPRKEWYYVYGK